MRQRLTETIQKALAQLGIEAGEVRLEHPADLSHGDYATNAALTHSREGNPKTLADALADKLEVMEIEHIASIDVAGPGFINFRLDNDFYMHEVKRILKDKERYGKNKTLSGQRVMIEYTDPNPFKEFHIGHLMSNTIGEALSRIYEWSGAEVKRANYQGDVGLHVAKALWGMRELSDEMPADADPIENKARFLGKAYAFGAEAYEKSEHARHSIREINIRLYKKTDEELNNLYQWGRKTSLEYFESLYKRLGTTFDFYFFESETGELGKKIVRKHMGKVFEESEGAYVFRGEKKGLHTRVFLNKEGLPTYEAKELGLAELKHQKYSHDTSIVVSGNEINEYFNVVLAAMTETAPELAKKTKHIGHGMMRRASGKMSSRTGDVIAAEDFLNDVYKEVYERIAERDMPKEEKHSIAEKVSLGALKYSILKQGIGHDIVFDKEKALSLEGDSGPYLEYSYVRTQSIAENARKEGIAPDAGRKKEDAHNVEKLLYRFPEVIEDALSEHAPQHVTTYLTELASAFNSYYGDVRIVDPDDPESPYRVALTEAVGVVLKGGMHILGFETPERM